MEEIDDNLWNLLDDFKNDKEDLNEEDIGDTRCKQQNEESIYVENGLNICTNCGSIQDRIIDSSAEWRFYGSDDSKSSDPTRCGLPVNNLLPESSLGSVIGGKGFQSMEMQKIRKYHTWNSMPYKKKGVYSMFLMH